MTPHTTRARTGKEATGEREDKSAGDRATATQLDDGNGTAGDVPGYQPTPEDLRLRDFYGDWIHANPSTRLVGGIRDDLAWQACWNDLAVMPLRRYDAPNGKVGQRFVGTLGE